jgi:hypothetical protein
MEFAYTPVEVFQSDYSAVIEHFKIQSLVPSDINCYNFSYLGSEQFVRRSRRYLNQELSVEG